MNIKEITSRNAVRKYAVCLFFIVFLTCATTFASYEVKGEGVSSVVYGGGKAITSKSADQVVYVVDLENKKVIRTGVFNAGIKEGALAGLQADNTEYQIVYDVKEDLVTRDRSVKPQHIIKAIGQTGALDGFETIVIGDDFITTSNSKFDYFVLYYYKRTQ